MEGRAVGHNFERDPPRDHTCQVWFNLVQWFQSLDGPLPKLCPVIPTSNQDGCQAKNRKKGGWNIPARFGLIWFSGFRGKDLNVIFYQNMPNLHNRYKSAERKILQKNPGVRQPRPPFKMAAVTKNRNFFSCQFPLYYRLKKKIHRKTQNIC
jgi:hypothetical protein